VGISPFALFAVLEDMEAESIFNEILKGLTLTFEEVWRNHPAFDRNRSWVMQ
jgi:hypothetical protein